LSANSMSSSVMLVNTPVMSEDWRSSFKAVWSLISPASLALATVSVTLPATSAFSVLLISHRDLKLIRKFSGSAMPLPAARHL